MKIGGVGNDGWIGVAFCSGNGGVDGAAFAPVVAVLALCAPVLVGVPAPAPVIPPPPFAAGLAVLLVVVTVVVVVVAAVPFAPLVVGNAFVGTPSTAAVCASSSPVAGSRAAS